MGGRVPPLVLQAARRRPCRMMCMPGRDRAPPVHDARAHAGFSDLVVASGGLCIGALGLVLVLLSAACLERPSLAKLRGVWKRPARTAGMAGMAERAARSPQRMPRYVAP